jgi:hypothetical protein
MATREYGIVVGEARVRPVHKGFQYLATGRLT